MQAQDHPFFRDQPHGFAVYHGPVALLNRTGKPFLRFITGKPVLADLSAITCSAENIFITIAQLIPPAMNDAEIQRLIENANKGIAEGKPQFVLSSNNKLRNLNKKDVAENILRDAYQSFPTSIEVFRALCTAIRERDPAEALAFAEAAVAAFGNPARFQKALALAAMDRRNEAIKQIEAILAEEPAFTQDRFVVSKLFDLYNDEGLFPQARKLLEPLVDQGVFTDVRMKQLLATVLNKLRHSQAKVLDLLQNDVDPQSEKLKQWAREIMVEIPSTVTEVPASGLSKPQSTGTPSVFVVHGHDLATLSQLENTLHRIGALPQMFDRLPKQGSPTIIEILEEHVPNADAIVTLLTPDDEGRKRGDQSPLEPRARQNVLVEAGFAMISRRTRSILVAIGGVTVPTDFDGIHRIQAEEWKPEVGIRIAQRLREMGLAVEPSKAV